MAKGESNFEKRRRRVRFSLSKRAAGKLRLSVHRSGKHIYAQIIDDRAGVTLVSASTLDKSVFNKKTSTAEAAHKVGEIVAKKALESNITNVVFDRGGFLFHGRIKAVADGARSAGLVF
jgi:large subunit ribosomal protein L18